MLVASFSACFMHQAARCKASYQRVKQGACFEACSVVEKSEPAITCSMVHQILYTPRWLFHAFSPCKAKVQVVSYSLGLE